MKTRMKKLISISTIPVLALALLVVLGTFLAAGPAADGHRHDIAAIEDVLNQYILAMEAGDLDLWMSLCTDDIVKMQPDVPATFGKEALRASMKPLFDNFKFEEFTLYDMEIQVADRWAFTRCDFTVTLTPKAGGEPLYMDCKDLCIYKRQAGGSWKIARDCFNSNVPPVCP